MKEEKLPYIDISFDFLAFSLGINTFAIDENSFERIQYVQENERERKRFRELIYLIKNKFPKNS